MMPSLKMNVTLALLGTSQSLTYSTFSGLAEIPSDDKT